MIIKKTSYLYKKYETQSIPQPCFVQLSCDHETLTADWNPEIGNAIPMDVYHKRTLQWTIPILKEAAADHLLTELKPYAEIIIAGYANEYNGSNHVGTYTDIANEAIGEITHLCAEAHEYEDDLVRDMHAYDYLDDCDLPEYLAGITKNTTDIELENMGDLVRADAKMDGVDELENLGNYLEDIRDRAREEEIQEELKNYKIPEGVTYHLIVAKHEPKKDV